MLSTGQLIPEKIALVATVKTDTDSLFWKPLNSMSLAFGFGDGYTQCGHRTVNIVNKATGQKLTFPHSFLTLIDDDEDEGDEETLILEPLEKDDVGEYLFTF